LPSPIAHSIIGSTFYFASRDSSKWRTITLLAYIIAASLPDFDFFSVVNGTLQFSNLYHRGFTHSIFFAVFIFVITALFMRISFKKKISPFLLFVLVSHVILDFFSFDSPESVNGHGVQLFWPLSNEYYISLVTFFRGPETQDLLNPISWQSSMFDFILLIPLVAVIIYQKYFSNAQLKRETTK